MTPPLPLVVVVGGGVVVVGLVLVVGCVVVDLVLVSVLAVLVAAVGSVEDEVVEVDGRLVLEELLPPPLSLAITTTATIRPMMIASKAATR